MNYLELCQRVASEAGIPGGGPTTVAGQTGELLRTVRHVASAWDEIQELRPNWAWQRGEFTFNTGADQAAYSLSDLGIAATFNYYEKELLKIYKQADGVATEGRIRFLDYGAWWRHFNVGSQTSQPPQRWSVRPEDDALILAPAPDAVYVCTGVYWKAQTHLADNEDTPALNANFHMAIVWKALTYYGDFEHDVYLRTTAQQRWEDWQDRLERRFLPPVTIGEAAIGEPGCRHTDTAFDLD